MRRSSPALFEVLGGGTVGRRPGAPTPTGPIAPPVPARNGAPIEVVAPEPVAPAHGHEPAREPWDSEPPPRSFTQRRYTISLSVVLLSAAGVIALLVLAWTAAYDAGKKEAEEAARRDLRLQSAGGVRDPLNSDLPLNTGLVKPGAPPAPAIGAPATGAQQPRQVAGDPREPGKNYLQLITTDQREAEGIVKFLGENSIAAFIVGVDGTGSTAKNPARFTVLCAKGITREEFQAHAPAREDLYEATGRLGKVWKGERRGSTDFSGRFWSKHKG